MNIERTLIFMPHGYGACLNGLVNLSAQKLILCMYAQSGYNMLIKLSYGRYARLPQSGVGCYIIIWKVVFGLYNNEIIFLLQSEFCLTELSPSAMGVINMTKGFFGLYFIYYVE